MAMKTPQPPDRGHPAAAAPRQTSGPGVQGTGRFERPETRGSFCGDTHGTWYKQHGYFIHYS